jgi:hypothetical protein
MYMPHIWLKSAITRIMTIYEKRNFQELLEIIRINPIYYTPMDLNAFLKINISENCSYEH